MNLRPSIALYLLFFTVGFGSHSLPVSAQAPAAAQQLRDGQDDFDFHFGTWHTHIRLLVHPLTGSNTWVESDGTVTVRKIWNGRANLEELQRNDASSLQPRSPSVDGTLNTPLIGEFKNGRGEFYGQERCNDRTILVRFVWSDITADSYHVEQSYSADGGKIWESNFVANLTREKE